MREELLVKYLGMLSGNNAVVKAADGERKYFLFEKKLLNYQ